MHLMLAGSFLRRSLQSDKPAAQQPVLRRLNDSNGQSEAFAVEIQIDVVGFILRELR